jgi:hypothetical protein
MPEPCDERTDGGGHGGLLAWITGRVQRRGAFYLFLYNVVAHRKLFRSGMLLLLHQLLIWLLPTCPNFPNLLLYFLAH